MATSCDIDLAFSRHSSDTAAIRGTVLTGRGFGGTAGDRFVMLGERAVIDGELETDECGLVLIRA